MTTNDERLGIEFISVLGLPPVPYVQLAAELGCRNIGIALAPIVSNPHGYPRWSLRENPQLRRDLVTALADHGVSVSLGEGFLVRPGASIAESAADLDLMCEIGAVRINVLCIDPDLHRTVDELATFTEMVASRGLTATLEFIPGMPIGDVAGALAAIRHVGRSELRLLIDFMHVFRSGASVSDLAALDPAEVGYIQICDVPLVSRFASYAEEARDERLKPGEGELPLLRALEVLPRDLVVGLEVPMRAKAAAGIGPRERLAGCVHAARALLAQLGG
jgi:sugar phosphate isomerase/epimerase